MCEYINTYYKISMDNSIIGIKRLLQFLGLKSFRKRKKLDDKLIYIATVGCWNDS